MTTRAKQSIAVAAVILLAILGAWLNRAPAPDSADDDDSATAPEAADDDDSADDNDSAGDDDDSAKK